MSPEIDTAEYEALRAKAAAERLGCLNLIFTHWWKVIGTVGLLALAVYMWRAGISPAELVELIAKLAGTFKDWF